jgi:hypothetical protein
MSERKLLTKEDLREDNRPTGPIDAALKAPVGSGFLRPMAAYAGMKLFGDKKKKQKYEKIHGMKFAVRGRKAGSSAEKPD